MMERVRFGGMGYGDVCGFICGCKAQRRPWSLAPWPGGGISRKALLPAHRPHCFDIALASLAKYLKCSFL